MHCDALIKMIKLLLQQSMSWLDNSSLLEIVTQCRSISDMIAVPPHTDLYVLYYFCVIFMNKKIILRCVGGFYSTVTKLPSLSLKKEVAHPPLVWLSVQSLALSTSGLS